MSAREDFLQRIGSTYEAWVDEFVDAHAHELAEKIRQEALKRWPDYDDPCRDGADVAADLIDPESDRE